MQKRKTMKLLGAAMLASLFFAACSKSNADDQTNKTPSNPSQEASAPKNEPVGSQAPDAPIAPSISCETIRLTRTKDSGEEFIFAEYPKFSISSNGYEPLRTALDSINQELLKQSEDFILAMEDTAKNNTDPSVSFYQSTDSRITRCDADIVCLLVSKCMEEGGPHPNNYLKAYNLDAKTGEALTLSDVLTVDAALQENIRTQLYENYPEISFDDSSVKQDVASALENNEIEWYFRDNQLFIEFRENSFGLSHAEGSLGVSFSL